MVSDTTLRIRRLDGGLLVVEGAAMARRFFAFGVDRYDLASGMSAGSRISRRDISLLNEVMGARTAYADWQPLLGRSHGWLRRIDPSLDLIRTSERRWRESEAELRVRAALAAVVGPRRGPAVTTKLLHLKRPRLFPIVDRLSAEMLGAGRSAADPATRCDWLLEIVLHVREQGRANLPALNMIQSQLRADGFSRSLVRIVDAVLWSSHPAAGGAEVDGRVIHTRLGKRTQQS